MYLLSSTVCGSKPDIVYSSVPKMLHRCYDMIWHPWNLWVILHVKYMHMCWGDKEFQSIFLSLWSFVCFTYYGNGNLWHKHIHSLISRSVTFLCVSAPAVLVPSASVQAAKHLRCQHLPGLNSINQINDDSNLSAVHSPPRTSWAIYRYCDPRTRYKVFSPAGCFCGCSSAAGMRAQMGQVTMPYILPPSVLLSIDII